MLMTWYGFAENSRAKEEKYMQHKVKAAVLDIENKSQTNMCKIQNSKII